MEHWRRNPVVFWVTSLPPTLWLVVFFLIPLGIIWVLSFGEKRGIVDIEITWVLDNYARAFDPLYLQIFAKSLWMAGITTLICLAIGFPIALFITFAPPRWKPWLLLLIILPFWTNLLIRTFAWIIILGRGGVIETPLLAMGIIEKSLRMMYTDGAIAIGLTYSYLPLMVLPIYASLEKLDFRLLEAASDLYASRLEVMTKVVIPLCKPGIIAGCLLVFIPCLGAFIAPNLLGGGKKLMLGSLVQFQFASARNWPFGAALSMLLLSAVVVMLIFYARSAKKRAAMEGSG